MFVKQKITITLMAVITILVGVLVWCSLNNFSNKWGITTDEYKNEIRNLTSQIENMKEDEKRLRGVIKEQDINISNLAKNKNNNCGCESCDTWKEYYNKELGFFLKYPKYTHIMVDSVCINNNVKDDVKSKSMEEQGMEQIIVQSGNNIYVVPKYYYNVDNGCEKTLNTKDNLNKSRKILGENRELKPTMFFFVIKNENDIASIIKKRWGKNCVIIKKEESKQKGVYDIKFGDKNTGGFNPSNKDGCMNNGKVIIKYAPFKQRMLVWPIGQDCSISSGLFPCADEEILTSFKFL